PKVIHRPNSQASSAAWLGRYPGIAMSSVGSPAATTVRLTTPFFRGFAYLASRALGALPAQDACGAPAGREGTDPSLPLALPHPTQRSSARPLCKIAPDAL